MQIRQIRSMYRVWFSTKPLLRQLSSGRPGLRGANISCPNKTHSSSASRDVIMAATDAASLECQDGGRGSLLDLGPVSLFVDWWSGKCEQVYGSLA